MRSVTTTQVIRRERGLRYCTAEVVLRQVGVIKQPVDVQAQSRSVGSVIRDKQVGGSGRRRRRSIACKNRNELSLAADIGTEERAHVGEARAALLGFGQSFTGATGATLRIPAAAETNEVQSFAEPGKPLEGDHTVL